MSVPIHFTGEDESEAGKISGMVIQHLVTEIEISALPRDLPEFLAVDLSGLEPGDVVMLSDIEPPEGVEIPALAADDADEIMIANTVHIKESQGTGAAAEAEAEAAAAAELEIEDADVTDEADEADESEDTEEDQS